MFCQSCGTSVTHARGFCTRCGVNLNKEDGKSRTEELLDGAFWTTVFGLAIVVGGVTIMKNQGVRDALIIAYMILSTLAFLGIYGMHLWLFVRLHRRDKESGSASSQDERQTKELAGSEIQALPEPAASVTEGTTRSFEPLYNQQKKAR